MPKGGQIQTSALFGIFMVNLSLGKSEDLPGSKLGRQPLLPIVANVAPVSVGALLNCMGTRIYSSHSWSLSHC